MRKVRVESREFRRAIQGSNMSLVWLYSLPDESVTPSSPHTAVPFIYVFIVCCLYVPWLGIAPTALTYLDNVLTSWAAWPGLVHILLLRITNLLNIYYIQLVLRTLYVLNALVVVTAINFLIGMRGPRHSEVEGLVQGHRPKCGGGLLITVLFVPVEI